MKNEKKGKNENEDCKESKEKENEWKANMIDVIDVTNVKLAENRSHGKKTLIYACEIDNYTFKYETNYQLELELIGSKPFKNMKIVSNVSDNIFVVKIATMKELAEQEREIGLSIHSHKGHHDIFAPERMLRSDNDYYLSSQDDITNDWIVFKCNNENASEKNFEPLSWIVTKVQVRTRGTGYSSIDGDPFSLKRFEILIGNADSNEWIKCNQDWFVADKMNPNLQTFVVDYSKDKQEFKQIMRKIIAKKYKHFKLAIADNYGKWYILITEFKLFGALVG